MLRRWPAFLPVLGLTLLPATISLVAQHPPVERVPEMPTHELNEESVPKEKVEVERIEPPKLDNSSIHLTPKQWEAMKRAGSIVSRTPTTLRWEKTQDSSSRLSWSARSQIGTANIEVNELEFALSQGSVFINEGNLPRTKEWHDLNSRYPEQMIVHEPESANRDPETIRAAIRLADRPLDPARVKVFNALPCETELENFSQEQNRMMVGGTPDYWKELNREIRAKSGAVIPHRATREAVLEELRTGTSDVVMLYAHFDGEQLHMPGAHGEPISVDEIAQVNRRRDPRARPRVIILVACSTGARTPGNARSLTSVLLEKGLADTVMATDHPFQSRKIPDLLTRLFNGTPLRKAVGLHEQNATPGQNGSFLQQFVELQSPVLNNPAERGERQDQGE